MCKPWNLINHFLDQKISAKVKHQSRREELIVSVYLVESEGEIPSGLSSISSWAIPTILSYFQYIVIWLPLHTHLWNVQIKQQ